MEKSLLSAIGNTPLIKLSNMFGSGHNIHVFAKLELLNPGGSAKDRPALRMMTDAWQKGQIGPGSVVIESSSGNMAISLAIICSYLGLRFISVVDPKTAQANLRILQAYGAEIVMVHEPDPNTGEYLPARLQHVQQLLADIPDSFWPNQYANENNYRSHCDTTMKEIIDELGHVDYLFGAVSTCGTLLGCSTYVKQQKLATQIVAVDAEGSIIFGGEKKHRFFPGIGAGIVPPFGQTPFADRLVYASDTDMVIGCRQLVKQESILAGPSSGGVLMAVRKIEQDLPSGSICVVIVHDRGERYLDTVYSDEWVQQKLGLTITKTRSAEGESFDLFG